MPLHPRAVVAALVAAGLGLASFEVAGGAEADHTAHPTTLLADALKAAPAQVAPYRPLVHRAVPQDRYAMAGGCYAVRGPDGHWLTRTGGTFTATGASRAKAEPFHFQAFDLGKYLLYGGQRDFLAAATDPAPGGARPATDVVEGYVRGTSDETLAPVREPAVAAIHGAGDASDTTTAPVRDAIRGDGVISAAKPSADAEWVVTDEPGGTFGFRLAVDDHDPANPGPLHPRIRATLTTTSSGALALVKGDVRGPATRFALHRTTGCAHWPEVQVNVTGPYAHGGTPYGSVRGFLDAHLHMMAFEFLGGRARCGRPWHPYGVTYALVDCPDHTGHGYGAVLEQVLSGHIGQGHDTVGWPTFGYWPRYDSLTHEQVYYKWLERAWRGGLRMFTNLLVENGVLCEIYPLKKNNCNEMHSVRLQARRLHELERYIDAQSGGPGRGWFRIVYDPFEARRVINAGKLAVVMGIEVSVPLNCGEYLGIPRCTKEQVEHRMQGVYDLGVRQMELTNKFDNALTGVTGDEGATGVLVNTGNRYETGHYWQLRTCPDTPKDPAKQRYDKTQYNLADESDGTAGRDAIFGAVLKVAGMSGVAPAYPAGPHCNVIGLSQLGKDAISAMETRGMVFDPDHMSALARQEAMKYVADTGYGGVVSSHSWADAPTYKAVLRQGGVVTPHALTSYSFVNQWRQLRHWANPDFLYGLGWGSDVNGFSVQGAPRKPPENDDVDYPFRGFGGVTVHQQVSGKRVYDINTDGVDHYGLYPDWVADGVELADRDGAAFWHDLTLGPEAYLEMWERAIGIQGDSCRADVPDLSGRDLARVHRGMLPEQVLAELGQPHTRAGTTFTYCGQGGRLTVAFDRAGRVASVD